MLIKQLLHGFFHLPITCAYSRLAGGSFCFPSFDFRIYLTTLNASHSTQPTFLTFEMNKGPPSNSTYSECLLCVRQAIKKNVF